MFASNIVIGYVTVEILRSYGRNQRKAEKLPDSPQRNPGADGMTAEQHYFPPFRCACPRICLNGL